MITKSDIIILLISFSVLMFGLYRTFDPGINLDIKKQLNISQWFSFSNKSEKVTRPESVSEVDQQQTQAAAAQPPTLANASESTTAQPLQTAVTQNPVVAAKSSIPSEEKQLPRVPGKTTVLVLSPRGNKLSDDSDSDGAANPQIVSTSPAAQASEQSNLDTVALLSDNDGSGEQYIEPAGNEASFQTTTGAELEPEKARVSIHEVQSGENLTSIATKLGTTVERLKQINRLPDDRILAGQNLIYEN